MHCRDGIVAIFVCVTLFDAAVASLVTVTEYPSSCKAVYSHTPYYSTKVIQSTVTVTPSPYSDHSFNDGTPFVLEVQTTSGNTRKRATKDAIYLEKNGFTTASMDHAAQYVIQEGKLTTTQGGYVSVDQGVAYDTFAVLSYALAGNSTFKVHHGILNWANANFTDGAAAFFETFPNGSTHHAEILVKFSGPTLPAWTAVVLAAMPPSASQPAGSSAAVSKHHSKDHTKSTSHHTHTDHHNATTAYSNQSMTSTKLSPSASTSNTISPNGLCGLASGHICLGSGFGDCCSQYGDCGSGDTYCAVGCQSAFGSCWSPSVTSGAMSMSSSSSSSIPISTFTSVGMPIGPDHPLNFSTSTIPSSTSMTFLDLSSSSISSATMSMTSSTPSAPPCPVTQSSLCDTSTNASTTCSSAGGNTYNTSCGVEYDGSVINTTDIVGLPPRKRDIDLSSVNLTPQKRAIEPTLADCQALCDYFTACVALNYVGTNCTLLSTVTSTKHVSGAVGAAVPAPDEAKKTQHVTTTTISTTAMSVSMASSSASIFASTSAVMVSIPTTTQPIVMSTSNSMIQTSDSSALKSKSSAGTSTSEAVPATSSAAVLSSTSTAVMASSTTTHSTASSASTTTSTVGGSSSSSMSIMTSSTSHAPSQTSTSTPSAASSSSSSISITTSFTSYVSSQTSASTSSAASSSSSSILITTSSTSYVSSQTSASNPTVASSSSSSMSIISSSASHASSQISASSSSATSSSSSMSIMTSATSHASSQTSAPTSSVASSSMTGSSKATSSITSMSSTISSTISSASSSAPTGYLVLPSPTPCAFGDPAGTDENDSFCKIALPFSMQIYSKTDISSYASTNGYISIQYGSSQYSNSKFPASNIPNNTVAPFFDDLYLQGNSTPQDGIFYQFNTAQTGITYEYYVNRGPSVGTVGASQTYHFTVSYVSTSPGIFTYTYYQTGGASDNGLYAAVGMQGMTSSGTEEGFTYSFQTADITPGLVVTCNTLTNSCATTKP